MTTQHSTISTPVNYATYFDERIEEIMRILRANMKIAECEKVHRPIGRKEAKFPAVHIQPKNLIPDKETTGKYQMLMRVIIYQYEVGNAPDKIWAELSKAQGILLKLFSDNANDDLFSAAPTFKYAVHPPYWVEAVIENSEISEPWRFRSNEETLAMGCRSVLKLTDIFTI